jgi:serine/threonine protein kinase
VPTRITDGSDPPEAYESPGSAIADGLPGPFGKYTLLRRRATGGMAELFVARAAPSGPAGPVPPRVVIKRVLPSLGEAGDTESLGRMLMHEARVMAALSHPNVANVLDAGCVDGVHFIALERVHGEDLRSIVRQMRKRRVAEFPIEHALGIVLGVCAGLAHVHERRGASGVELGIVHRDVSPQNVLVTFAGEIKLVDFGIATSPVLVVGEPPASRPRGKLPYMSPEQARGETVDGRSDVFSAGVMLFELTTGHRLFKAAGERETLELILERDYPRPSALFADYPRALEPIVVRALAKDRADRWQSAREMHDALEGFVRDERAAVSSAALGRMMTSLFEAELAEEEAALAEADRRAFSPR